MEKEIKAFRFFGTMELYNSVICPAFVRIILFNIQGTSFFKYIGILINVWI